MPSHYTYSALADLPGIIARQQQQQGQVQANRPVAVYLYGVVCSFGHRHQTAGDKLVSVNLIDETVPDPADSVNTNLFSSRWGDLPQVAMVGDILRFHRADLTVRATPFGPRPQLVARVQARSAWVLLRRRRLKAAVYQTGPEGGGSNGAAVLAGGGVGTAAAGGHATSFDPREWEVLHNHGSMTIEANDVERARRLSDWFLGALPTIRFNNPGASKTLSAVFAPPSPAAAAAAQENRLTQMDEYADVVGVLTGLEESTEGGQSAVSRFTVWDGTVPPVTLPTSEVDAAVDAAIRAAGHLPPPLMPRAVRPSLLNVRVAAHGVPLLDLGLRMGLWVRLRRLQVRKNLVTRTLDASVGFTTAVNLLPPTTAEVHACVLAYLAAATAPGTGAAGVVPLPISARIPANAGGAGAALPQTPVARTAPMTTLTLPRPLAATGLAVSGAGAAASQPFRCSIEEILGLPAPAECRCQVRAIKFFTMPGGQVIRKRKRGATGGAGGDSSGADGAGDGASDGTEHIMALRLEDETAAIDAIVCGETLVRVLLGGLSPDAVEVDTAAAAQAQERLRWLVSGAEPHPMELTVASSYRNLPGGGREKTYAVLGPIVPSAA
ncbi:unnamed protein product [Phaeothamnion confervicola]